MTRLLIVIRLNVKFIALNSNIDYHGGRLNGGKRSERKEKEIFIHNRGSFCIVYRCTRIFLVTFFSFFFLNIFIRSLGRNVEINRCQIGNFPFMKRLEGIMKAARYRD